MEKEECISITHFINPQLFWYHKVDVQNPDLLESKRIEESVQLLYTAKQSAAIRAHRPQVGEIVAIAFVSWNKFIRARVMHIIKYMKTADEYIVWALDYGFPFQTKMTYIRHMPELYHKQTDYIRVGGIANVVPAELEFDLVTTTSQIMPKPEWSQRCVEMLEKLLNDAASVSFIESFKYDGNERQHFGDMKVIAHSGSTFFVSDYLVKLNHALKCEADFGKKLKNLKTNRIPCWETNKRDIKIIENKLHSLNIEMGKFDLSGSMSETAVDPSSKQKVMDWCERNQNVNDDDAIKDTTEILFPKSAFDATDIEFDDSVSVKCDDELLVDKEEMVMNYAGKIHENRRKKYEGKELPPAPALGNFIVGNEQSKKLEMDEKSQVSGRSSSRAKILMELKKAHCKTIEAQKTEKMLQKQMDELNLNEQSETGTDEFLEKCKKKNALNFLRNENGKNCQDNNSLKNIDQSSQVSSNISKRKQQLMKLKGTYCKPNQNTFDISRDTVATDMQTLDDKSETKSQASSKVSLHVESLIKKRNKLLQQRAQAKSSGMIESQQQTEEIPVKKSQKQSGYKMPQLSAKFSRLDFSKGFRQYATNFDKKPNETFPKFQFEDEELKPKPKQQQPTVDEVRKLINEDPFKNMTMVPAGFDVTKLVKRRDEQNHWHTKKSTLHDKMHSNYSSNNDYETFNNSNDISQNSDSVEVDFFRLTQSRKERKKTGGELNIETNLTSSNSTTPTIKNTSPKKSSTDRSDTIADSSSNDAKTPTIKISPGRTLLDSSFIVGSPTKTERVINSDECTKPKQTISVQKHLLDLSLNDQDCPQPAITPEVVTDLLIFDDDKKKSIDTTPSSKKQDDKDKFDEFEILSKLIDFNSTPNEVTEALNKSNSADSLANNTSRERLLQTSNASEESFVSNSKKIKKYLSLNNAANKATNSVEIDCGIECSSCMSSIEMDEKKKEPSLEPNQFKDPYQSYEASESSVSSNSIGKLNVQTRSTSSLSGQSSEQPEKGQTTTTNEKQKEKPESSPTSSTISPLRSPNSLSLTCKPNTPSPKILSEKEYLQSLGNTNHTLMIPQRTNHNTMPEVSGEASLKTNFIQHLVLAHSKNNVKPIESMKNALFSAEIHQEMEHMRLTKLYRIQAYAWSHLVRGNSFYVINANRTGKTWCYLPPICSMLSFRLESKGIPQSYGPAVIIIAPSSVQVESIVRHCRRILASTTPKISIVPAYGYRNNEEVKIDMHNGCGILVITPPCLQRLLIANEKENLLNIQRLQILVIDGLDNVMNENPEFDDTLQKLISPVMVKDTIPFQMVVTSRTWTRRFVNFLRISNQPLLCIADYLEAAVYAKAKVSFKFQSSSEKMSVAMKCLDKCSYETERCVIVCNSVDEVIEVERCLRESGYMCMMYTDQMPTDNANAIKEWKGKSVCHQILIANDTVLPELAIQNAWTLIHFSMPTSWTKFNFRFSLFLDNYENLLITNFAKPTKVPKSLILLDENNNLQLPRLIEFMKSHNQLQHIHPDILNVSARVTAEREELRVLQNILMCPKILEFGVCDESNRCSFRHQLTKYDGPIQGIPKSGEIRLKILEVISPTHYIARILTHKQQGSWEVVRQSNEFPMFSIRMTMHLMNEENQIAHWPPKVNDFCVYKDGNTFHRCRVLEVPPIVYESIVKTLNIKVKLIDSGRTIMCKSHDLMEIPDEFKDFPAQAIDIRLSGVVPYDNEKVWDSKSIRTVKKWIVTDVTENDVLQASINFVLMDVIWVNNVVLMEQLTAINGFALKINVRRSLLGRGFALDDNQMQSIKQIAMENNLLKPSVGVTTVQKSEEEENLLEFSTASSSDYKNSTNSGEQMFTPVAVTSVQKEEDSTTMTTMGPIVMPEDNEQTPKLNESWVSLEVDKLMQAKIMEISSPNVMFVRLLNREEDMEDLADLIYRENKSLLNNPHPMENCLASREGSYHRGKIQRILVDSEDGCVKARVFFCDLGLFRNIRLDKLRSSTKAITEFMPFQAICCKLTGINIKCDRDEIQKFIQMEDSVHMVYAVKKLPNSPVDDVFDRSPYEIILYECFTDKKDIQINKMLVEHGLASYNDETKHFLELETEVDFENFDYQEGDSYDFQAFLDRIKQQMDEEDREMLQESLLQEDEDKEEPKIIEITEDDDPKSTLKSSKEQVEEKLEDDDQKVTEHLASPPSLKALHKRPLTTWHETMFMINLVIHAPDIDDYHLEVHPKSVIFVAIVNGETNVLILNLLGYVRPEMVTHEIRGLNVVVRLVKDLYMPWPRLLEDPTKFPWLKYNYNAVDDLLKEEEDTIFGKQRKKRRLSESSDTSSNSRCSNPCETFTPIVNTDQMHDPMQDFL